MKLTHLTSQVQNCTVKNDNNPDFFFFAEYIDIYSIYLNWFFTMKKILLVLNLLLCLGLALPQVKIDIRNLRATPKTDDICLNEQCIEASHRYL